MSTRLTPTVLPDLAAVRLEVDDAPAGELSILRSDVNGQRPVRLFAGQQPSAGQLVITDYEPALHGPVTYSLAGTRTNALANPSFETDTAGWTASGGLVITRDAADHAPGAGGVACAVLSGGAAASLAYPTSSSPAAAGETWTGSCYVKGTAGDTIRMGVVSYTAGGVAVAGFTYDTFVLDGTWQRLSQTRELPATSAGARIVVYVPVAGQVARVDGFMLEESPTLGAYREGTVDAAVSAVVSIDHAFPVVAVAVSPANRSEVRAFTDGTEDTDDGSTVHRVLDSPFPVAVQGAMSTRTGQLVAWCDSYEAAAELRATASTGDTVLVRHPEHTGLDLYARVRRVSLSPRAELVADELGPRRRWSVALDYLETSPPETPLQSAAGWTIGELAATFETVADVRAAFATIRALTVGP